MQITEFYRKDDFVGDKLDKNLNSNPLETVLKLELQQPKNPTRSLLK